MPNSTLPVLTEQHAQVLFVLWKDEKKRQSRGITNTDITEALQASFKRPRGQSLANVKKIVHQLQNWQPTPLLLSFRAGRERTNYRLPKDTMVTWAATARLLIILEDDSRVAVSRSTFVQQIAMLYMKNPDTGEALTVEEIEQQIDYLRNRQFPYIDEDGRGYIKATDRVVQERPFLELLAAEAGDQSEPDFDIFFDSSFPPDAVNDVLTALANYFRACGGAGFELDLGLQETHAMEAVND